MNTTIKLRCIDQVLTFESTPVVASGGLEEDKIVVSFCSKWDGMTKTAVFWRTEDDAYHVVLDDDDGGTIPREVLASEGVIFFGLFGVNADGLRRTSQVARYNITKGAITEGTQPSNPTPEFWDQALAKCQELADIAAENRRAESVFEQAMVARQEGFEQAMVDRQASFEESLGAEVEAINEVVQNLAEQGTVDTEQIKDGAVTQQKLKDGAVGTEQIKDGAVTQQKLAAGLQTALDNAMPKTGGTFTGAVYAMGGAGSSAQLRNTALVSSETSPTVNGQINWTYL